MISQHSISTNSDNSKKGTVKPRKVISNPDVITHCEVDDSNTTLLPDEKLTRMEAEETIKLLEIIHDLKFFLLTAPVNWHENQVIRRYYLNKEEGFVSCVYWNNLYFITGTDIVRSVAYKLELFGRKIVDRKKLEEGIFSDLRALKCGTSAVLEMPKSKFLRFLHRNQCLRTQKKQKVFFWFSVPHDRLFRDALARDLERELNGIPGATVSNTKFSRSFHYDHSKGLIPQLRSHILAQTGKDFIYIISDTQEDPAAEAVENNKQLENDLKTNDTQGRPSEVKAESSSKLDSTQLEKEKSEVESSPDFPLDYIQNDPFLFNVDGVGSVAEGNDFTYVQNPSSAFQPDQPALWLISPQGLGVSDDLLLDQATPVVPVFNTATPAHLRLPWSTFAPNAPRTLWNSGTSPSHLGSPGLAMLTTQSQMDTKRGRNSSDLKHTEELDSEVKLGSDKTKSQCMYTFVPGASSLASSGLSAMSLRGNIDKDSANFENETKQILTVPTMTAGGEPTFSAVLSPMVDTAGDNLRYYYGASPYFADFPTLPFSRPFSAIKSSNEGKRSTTSPAINTVTGSRTQNKIHSVEGGRIKKPKKNYLLNPSLRHLDLDLDLGKNAELESTTRDVGETKTDESSNKRQS